MRKTIFLPVAALAAILMLPTSALAESVPPPTAKISSTKGSGSGGCVKSSKLVLFTLTPNWAYYSFRSATVHLDGKQIASRNFAVPAPAELFQNGVVKKFAVSVNLSSSKAGAHTLKLTGSVSIPAGRRSAKAASVYTPPAPPTFLGKVVQTARITKCAAFTG